MSILVCSQSTGLSTVLVRAGMMDYDPTSPAGFSGVFGRSSNRPRNAIGYRTPPGKPDSANKSSSVIPSYHSDSGGLTFANSCLIFRNAKCPTHDYMDDSTGARWPTRQFTVRNRRVRVVGFAVGAFGKWRPT